MNSDSKTEENKEYKYNILYELNQLTNERYRVAKSKIHLICKISKSTFERYIYLKTSEKTEVPATVLLTLAKFFKIEPKELCNFEIPEVTHEQLKKLETKTSAK